MILVIGASGYMGRETVKQLLTAGFSVRAACRSTERIADLARLGAETVQADLIDPPSLARACQGMEGVVSAAHSLMGAGKYSSQHVDGEGHRALIDATKAAGVKHFVYTSINGAAPDLPFLFGRIKYATEQHLKASGMLYTILRPTAFMEWHAHNFLGKPLLETGKTSILGRGETITNFISASDAAKFAVLSLTDERACDRIIDIGGWDNVTKNNLARMYAKEAGIEPKISHLPPAALKVMGAVLGIAKPEVGELMRMSYWMDKNEQAFHPEQLLKEFPVYLTRLDEFIRQKVAEFKSQKKSQEGHHT